MMFPAICDILRFARAKTGLRLVFTVFFLTSCLVSCSQPISKSAQGALAGAALGAGSGAIVGSRSGHAGPGTAIGAGIGLLGGALIGNSMDQVDAENEAAEAELRKNRALIEENKRLIEELRSRGADVRSSERGVVVNLPDILFEFDRAQLTPEAHRTLDEISDVVTSIKDRTIAVEGHTDSIGAVKYNMQLSEKRAWEVAKDLSRKGIPSQQVTVRGFGEGAPIASNNSEAGRARNRRVEIIIENEPRGF